MLATAAAATTTPPAAAPSPVQLDTDLQVLKDETLRLDADLDGVEQAMLYPDESMTTLYVSVKVGGFVLDQISVRINEDEPVIHVYSDSEALALLKDDGWQRILRKKLDPGTYRLQAEFTGHFFDARQNEPPVKGKVETLFEKGLTGLDLVLPVSRNTRLDKPGLSEIARLEQKKRPSRNVSITQPQKLDAAAPDASLGGANDPRYRAALFLKNDGRYLSALTELLEIEQSATDPATLPTSFRMLQAECYLGFGMESRAEGIYQQIATNDKDAANVARASLELAKFQYQRGYLNPAIESLNKIKPTLPGSLNDDWRLLMTDVLLAQERYAEAIDMLTAKGVDDDLPPVLRYNLAVALFKNGDAAGGRKQLNLVGTMDVSTLDMLVLRDKANLTLGYQYLQAQEGKNARTVFGRIRTQGPFSNRALLGLGWAEIAPATASKDAVPEESEGKNSADSLGTLLRPGYVDPKAGARADVPAAKPIAGLTPEEQDGLRRALVPWVELSKRDFMDPAVQEGMLGIPWALDRLHANEEALSRYTDAIAALETARKRMEDAMKSIKGGRMVETIVRRDVDSERGWTWRLRDLPDAPETYFLQSLLAEHRFQESIKNYRDARLLARNVDAWKSKIDALSTPGSITSAALAQQIRTAGNNWHPAWEGMPMWLTMVHRLGAPGTYDAPAQPEAGGPMALAVAYAPTQKFDGTVEKLRPLRTRLDALKPRIAAAANAQSDLLEDVSVRELGGQKAVIERYLTEARFAVARIYDRQLKGGK